MALRARQVSGAFEEWAPGVSVLKPMNIVQNAGSRFVIEEAK